MIGKLSSALLAALDERELIAELQPLTSARSPLDVERLRLRNGLLARELRQRGVAVVELQPGRWAR
jgi:hypothetical protein